MNCTQKNVIVTSDNHQVTLTAIHEKAVHIVKASVRCLKDHSADKCS